MLNEISVQGRLTKDPELRKTQNGTSVVSFTVACDRDYVANGSERETDFVDVVIWRQGADFVSKYFYKGDMILVAGRLQFRNWEDKDGNKRRNAEVLADHVYFGGPKSSGSNAAQHNAAPVEDAGGFYEGDGELPF